MRNLHELDDYRIKDPADLTYYGGWAGDDTHGAFRIPSPVDGETIVVVATSDMGWDHVSASRRKRVPSYRDMRHIKALFFKDDEVAMELHVPVSDHVNIHPNCLHLWAPHPPVVIPLPPRIFV